MQREGHREPISREWRGRGDARDITSFEYSIAGMGEAPHIVEETSSIVEETSSLAKPQGHPRMWNPLAVVSRSVGRLFARVSHSTTR